MIEQPIEGICCSGPRPVSATWTMASQSSRIAPGTGLVFDESQEVARAYDAVCTPDFFGYNADLKLQYRGRLDASKTTPVPGAIRELYEAMVQIAETGRGPEQQIPSMGCSIKWKAA